MTRQTHVRPGLLGVLLAAVAALLAVPALSLPVQPATGSFRDWQPLDIAPYHHAASGGNTTDLVYTLDLLSTFTIVNSATGRITRRNVTLDGTHIGWTGIATCPLLQRVYALRLLDDNNYTLAILDTDLQVQFTVDLNVALSPPLGAKEQVLPKPLVDSNCNAYIVRQQPSTDELLVSMLLPSGKQWSTWQPDVDPGAEYRTAIDGGGQLYFHASDPSVLPTDALANIYVQTSSKQNLTVALNMTDCPDFQQVFGLDLMAVSNDGTIAVSSGRCVLLFTAAGDEISSFMYASPLGDDDGVLQSLAFDASGRLLASDMFGAGVQVISASTGDVVRMLSDGVPELLSIQNIAFDQRSRSLLLAQNFFLPATRLDPESGVLLQGYTPPPLEDCELMASDVGAMTGDVYLLMRCEYVDGDFHVRLVALDRAGRIRRQVSMRQWTASRLQQDALLVAEDLDIFLLITAGEAVNRVAAFSLNGTNVFNWTDARIGHIDALTAPALGINPQLVRVNSSQYTLAVVDPAHSRIALLDIAKNAFFDNIKLAVNTYPVAAVHDGEYWYRSELYAPDLSQPWQGRVSLRQIAMNGDVVQYFALLDGLATGLRLTAAYGRLTLDLQRGRLYAAIPDLHQVAWWDVKQSAHQQQPTAIEAALPVYRPSREIHGRLPTACAIDERADELFVIDDNRGISVLSLSNQSAVLRSVPGVLRPDVYEYAVIQTLAVQPRRGNTSLLWLSITVDPRDSDDPRASLLVVDARDLSTVVHFIASNDTTPPLEATPISSLHASADGELMYGVVPLNGGVEHLYAFDAVTGRQSRSVRAPTPDARQMAVYRNSSTRAEQLLFVPDGSRRQPDSVYITHPDGLPWRTVPLVGWPTQQAPLADVASVDSAGRLWLMDTSGTLYAFSLDSGRLVANVPSSLLDDTPGWPHFAALTADGQRAFVLGGVSAFIAEVDTASGKQRVGWRSEQQPLWLPTVAAFDETGVALPERHIVTADYLGWGRRELSRMSLHGQALINIPLSIPDIADLNAEGARVIHDAPAGTVGDIALLVEWNPFNETAPHSELHRLTSNGSAVSSVDIPVAAELAPGANGTWWATDLDDSTVQHRERDGGLLATLPVRPGGAGAVEVWGVAALPDHGTLVVSMQYRQSLVELSLNGTALRTFGSTAGTYEVPYSLEADPQRGLLYVIQCVLEPGWLLPDRCFVRVWHRQSAASAGVSWTPVAELRSAEALGHTWLVHLSLSQDGRELLATDASYNRLLLFNVTAIHAQLPQHAYSVTIRQGEVRGQSTTAMSEARVAAAGGVHSLRQGGPQRGESRHSAME